MRVSRAAEASRVLEVMGTVGPIDLIVVVHHTGMYFDGIAHQA